MRKFLCCQKTCCSLFLNRKRWLKIAPWRGKRLSRQSILSPSRLAWAQAELDSKIVSLERAADGYLAIGKTASRRLSMTVHVSG